MSHRYPWSPETSKHRSGRSSHRNSYTRPPSQSTGSGEHSHRYHSGSKRRRRRHDASQYDEGSSRRRHFSDEDHVGPRLSMGHQRRRDSDLYRVGAGSSRSDLEHRSSINRHRYGERPQHFAATQSHRQRHSSTLSDIAYDQSYRWSELQHSSVIRSPSLRQRLPSSSPQRICRFIESESSSPDVDRKTPPDSRKVSIVNYSDSEEQLSDDGLGLGESAAELDERDVNESPADFDHLTHQLSSSSESKGHPSSPKSSRGSRTPGEGSYSRDETAAMSATWSPDASDVARSRDPSYDHCKLEHDKKEVKCEPSSRSPSLTPDIRSSSRKRSIGKASNSDSDQASHPSDSDKSSRSRKRKHSSLKHDRDESSREISSRIKKKIRREKKRKKRKKLRRKIKELERKLYHKLESVLESVSDSSRQESPRGGIKQEPTVTIAGCAADNYDNDLAMAIKTEEKEQIKIKLETSPEPNVCEESVNVSSPGDKDKKDEIEKTKTSIESKKLSLAAVNRALSRFKQPKVEPTELSEEDMMILQKKAQESFTAETTSEPELFAGQGSVQDALDISFRVIFVKHLSSKETECTLSAKLVSIGCPKPDMVKIVGSDAQTTAWLVFADHGQAVQFLEQHKTKLTCRGAWQSAIDNRCQRACSGGIAAQSSDHNSSKNDQIRSTEKTKKYSESNCSGDAHANVGMPSAQSREVRFIEPPSHSIETARRRRWSEDDQVDRRVVKLKGDHSPKMSKNHRDDDGDYVHPTTYKGYKGVDYSPPGGRREADYRSTQYKIPTGPSTAELEEKMLCPIVVHIDIDDHKHITVIRALIYKQLRCQIFSNKPADFLVGGLLRYIQNYYPVPTDQEVVIITDTLASYHAIKSIVNSGCSQEDITLFANYCSKWASLASLYKRYIHGANWCKAAVSRKTFLTELAQIEECKDEPLDPLAVMQKGLERVLPSNLLLRRSMPSLHCPEVVAIENFRRQLTEEDVLREEEFLGDLYLAFVGTSSINLYMEEAEILLERIGTMYMIGDDRIWPEWFAVLDPLQHKLGKVDLNSALECGYTLDTKTKTDDEIVGKLSWPGIHAMHTELSAMQEFIYGLKRQAAGRRVLLITEKRDNTLALLTVGLAKHGLLSEFYNLVRGYASLDYLFSMGGFQLPALDDNSWPSTRKSFDSSAYCTLKELSRLASSRSSVNQASKLTLLKYVRDQSRPLQSTECDNILRESCLPELRENCHPIIVSSPISLLPGETADLRVILQHAVPLFPPRHYILTPYGSLAFRIARLSLTDGRAPLRTVVTNTGPNQVDLLPNDVVGIACLDVDIFPVRRVTSMVKTFEPVSALGSLKLTAPSFDIFRPNEADHRQLVSPIRAAKSTADSAFSKEISPPRITGLIETPNSSQNVPLCHSVVDSVSPLHPLFAGLVNEPGHSGRASPVDTIVRRSSSPRIVPETAVVKPEQITSGSAATPGPTVTNKRRVNRDPRLLKRSTVLPFNMNKNSPSVKPADDLDVAAQPAIDHSSQSSKSSIDDATKASRQVDASQPMAASILPLDATNSDLLEDGAQGSSSTLDPLASINSQASSSLINDSIAVSHTLPLMKSEPGSSPDPLHQNTVKPDFLDSEEESALVIDEGELNSSTQNGINHVMDSCTTFAHSQAGPEVSTLEFTCASNSQSIFAQSSGSDGTKSQAMLANENQSHSASEASPIREEFQPCTEETCQPDKDSRPLVEIGDFEDTKQSENTPPIKNEDHADAMMEDRHSSSSLVDTKDGLDQLANIPLEVISNGDIPESDLATSTVSIEDQNEEDSVAFTNQSEEKTTSKLSTTCKISHKNNHSPKKKPQNCPSDKISQRPVKSGSNSISSPAQSRPVEHDDQDTVIVLTNATNESSVILRKFQGKRQRKMIGHKKPLEESRIKPCCVNVKKILINPKSTKLITFTIADVIIRGGQSLKVLSVPQHNGEIVKTPTTTGERTLGKLRPVKKEMFVLAVDGGTGAPRLPVGNIWDKVSMSRPILAQLKRLHGTGTAARSSAANDDDLSMEFTTLLSMPHFESLARSFLVMCNRPKDSITYQEKLFLDQLIIELDVSGGVGSRQELDTITAELIETAADGNFQQWQKAVSTMFPDLLAFLEVDNPLDYVLTVKLLTFHAFLTHQKRI